MQLKLILWKIRILIFQFSPKDYKFKYFYLKFQLKCFLKLSYVSNLWTNQRGIMICSQQQTIWEINFTSTGILLSIKSIKKKTQKKNIPLYMHGSLILAHDNFGQNSTSGCFHRSTNLSPLSKNYPYLLLDALPLH